MSKRIGEALIEKGFLSRSQLEHALRLQLIFGGHLGTCLVELGFVEEASLARTLSSILGMKCARNQQLDDIPADILRRMPREEVRRRRVVPFGVRRNALHVAVTKPTSVSGLSTRTGYRIVPYLAPEVYILRAMERYYGIPRRRRYLKVAYASVARDDRSDGSANPTARAPEPEPAPVTPSPPVNQPNATVMPRLGEHSRRMSRVNDHGELGEVILDFATERMERCILFHVEHDTAGIANWRGVEFPPSRVEQIELPLETESIFGLALEDSCYHGVLPRDFDCGRFYGRLGLEAPRQVLVLPIYGENQLEAVLYGDGGARGAVAGPTDAYLLLLDEVGLALRMLSFKRQLCPV